MAEIYLVRHAQASFGGDDYDQLSDQGAGNRIGWAGISVNSSSHSTRW